MASSRDFQFSTFTSLIRALFPRWDFFDRIAYEFKLEFEGPGAESWREVVFDQSWQPWQIFFNARTNLAMAQVNLIEHFAREVQELAAGQSRIAAHEVRALPAYRALLSLLWLKVGEMGFKFPLIRFRIIAKNSKSRLEIYTSDWIPAGAE